MNDVINNVRAGLYFCLVAVALFALPLSTSAQDSTVEEEVVSATSTKEVPESDDSGTSSVLASDVYKIEGLIGDKVFNDFVLGPGKIELVMEPGETQTVPLNVTNRYAEDKEFVFKIEDVGGSRNLERTVTLLGDDTGPYTLKDYISIPAMEFVLEPNKRAVVPVTITIPPDAEPGGKYGSVLVQTVTQKAIKGDEDTAPRSAIVSRIGTLFFITIPGDIDAEGEVVDFTTTNNQQWYEKGPVDFQILYENSGSVHLNPYGEIKITNMFGEEVGFVELEPWFTLPDSLRLREVTWNREALYGKYTAELKLNRGYDDLVDELSLTFWIVPWKIGLSIFGGLFVFFWLLKRFFGRFELKRK